MLLQRLWELREQLGDDYDTPESYKKRDVHFAVEIDKEGHFLDISRLGEANGKNQALKIATPDNSNRGGKEPPPFLFVDKPQYVLAVLDPKEKAKALSPEKAHQLFVQLVLDLVKGKGTWKGCSSNDEGYVLLQAAVEFLCGEQRQRATDELSKRYADRDLPDKTQQVYEKHQHPEKNSFFALRVDGLWLHDLPCARAFWACLCREASATKKPSSKAKKAAAPDPNEASFEDASCDVSAANESSELFQSLQPDTGELFQTSDTDDAVAPETDKNAKKKTKATKAKASAQSEEEVAPVLPCLVTGEVAPIARLHDAVRLGGQPCQIVSANSDAFVSYGHKQAYTSPVSQDAMKAYTESLRYLLERPNNRAFVGETGYVFWAKRGGQGLPIDIFEEVQPEQVRALLQSAFSGKKQDVDELQQSEFYAVALRSNQKRMIVRDYLETTLEQVQHHLKRWFEGHAILFSLDSGSPPEALRYFGLKRLASAFTRNATGEFKEMEKLSPLILDALFHAALTGRPLPLSLLVQLLQRIRNDGALFQTPQRAALLRMILNAHHATEVPMNAALDPQQHQPAYLCGRLFAVLEDLQRAALGKTNSTIADRFMGTASSAPASVFGRLLRGAQPHLQSLRKTNEPAYFALQDRIADILQHLPSFPMLLDLKEQGTFSLGYYHQRHQTRAEIRERKELKALANLIDASSSNTASSDETASKHETA
ncbi:type I-C CRISPR-associated protein Cas8c/Csd1 [Myxococcota bacterium]|nr:type I-C CRISPR-associated protein Cas8c/Csd1 [Myxococcota bacterium]